VKSKVAAAAVPEPAVVASVPLEKPVLLPLTLELFKAGRVSLTPVLFYMDSYGNNAAASSFLSQKELFGKKPLGNLAVPHNSHSS
jgi:hypothetical protein